MAIDTEAKARKAEELIRQGASPATAKRLQTEIQAFRGRSATAGTSQGQVARPATDPNLVTPALSGVLPQNIVDPIAATEAAMRGLASGVTSGIQGNIAGLQQRAGEVAVARGVPGAEAELAGTTQDEFQRRAEAEQQNKANLAALGIDEESVSTFDVGNVLASTAPEIGASLLTRRVPSGLARVIADTTVGTLAGASQFAETEAVRNANILSGLVFGSGSSAAGEALLRMPFIGQKALSKPLTQPLLAETENIESIAKRMGLEGSAELTPAQATLSEPLATLERASDVGIASRRQQRLRNQSNAIRDNFMKRADTLEKSNASPQTVAKAVRSSLNNTVDTLKNKRQQGLDQTIAAISANSEGAPAIPVQGIQERLTELSAEARNFATGVSPDARNALEQEATRLGQLGATQGGLITTRQWQGVQERLSGVQDIFDPMGPASARRSAQSLQEAIMGSLEVATNTLPEQAALVARARLNYAADSELIDQARGRALEATVRAVLPEGQELGQGTLSRRMLNMDSTAAGEVMNAIQDSDPLLADGLRGAIFRDMTFTHSTGSGFDVAGLLNDLTGGRGKTGTLQALFPDDKDLADGIRALDRVVFGGRGAAGGSGFSEGLSEAAVTVPSALAGQGSIGFLTRLMVGADTPAKLERMLFSPNAKENLRDLGRRTRGKFGAIDAMSRITAESADGLARNFQAMEAQDQRIEKQREEAEREEFANRERQRATQAQASPALGLQ